MMTILKRRRLVLRIWDVWGGLGRDWEQYFLHVSLITLIINMYFVHFMILGWMAVGVWVLSWGENNVCTHKPLNECWAPLPPHFTASSKLEEANKVVILRYVRGFGGLFCGSVLADVVVVVLLLMWTSGSQKTKFGVCYGVVGVTSSVCGGGGGCYWRDGLEEEKVPLTFRVCKICEVGAWVWGVGCYGVI